MRIAIEAQRIFRKKKHGMDMVVLEIIRELQKIDTTNEYFILVQPNDDRCLSETPNFHIVEVNCNFYPLWEQVALPYHLNKIKPDVIHCTSNTAPLYIPKNTPLVVTVHDIIYLEPKQKGKRSLYQSFGWMYRQIIVPRIIRKSDKIVTVSHYESSNIGSKFPELADRVKVIYNGYSKHFLNTEAAKTSLLKYDTDSLQLLFLGNTDPKKNVVRTLQAYSQYIEKSTIKRHLTIADLNEKVVSTLLKEHQLEHLMPYITLTNYVPNSELPQLYQKSWAFLYTSTRESFGIPLLEAMASGTPVITGNASALPEIAGDAALLCDTFSVESILEALLQLESSAAIYSSCINKGFERVKQFSWQIASQQTLRIYNQYDKKA